MPPAPLGRVYGEVRQHGHHLVPAWWRHGGNQGGGSDWLPNSSFTHFDAVALGLEEEEIGSGGGIELVVEKLLGQVLRAWRLWSHLMMRATRGAGAHCATATARAPVIYVG